MALQHLLTGGADLAAILLQAGENGEIALIDDGAAVTLHVTRAGLLLIGCTAPCCCWATALDASGIDNRASAKRNLRIVFLHFRQQKICSRKRFGMAGTDFGDCRRHVTRQRIDDKHC